MYLIAERNFDPQGLIYSQIKRDKGLVPPRAPGDQPFSFPKFTGDFGIQGEMILKKYFI